MTLKKIARIVTAASSDADRARKNYADPAFRKKVRTDRRGALSSFSTVQHALEDREKIEKRKRKKARS